MERLKRIYISIKAILIAVLWFFFAIIAVCVVIIETMYDGIKNEKSTR